MLKNQALIAALAATTLTAGYAGAEVVASYDAGVAPTAGTTGASNPTTQGWTEVFGSGSAGGWNHGGDSANGGWRITDGTGTGLVFYQDDLTAGEAAGMASNDWTATWTTAHNADAVHLSSGSGVDGHYDQGANQGNNAIWIEVEGAFRYILKFNADENNDLQLNDGTNSFQVTTAGDQLSQELGDGAPSVNYITYTLSYDAAAGEATLSDSVGNNHGVIATSGTAGANRVLWGAVTGSGQGSTTWNNLSVDAVPEPGSLALLGLGGLLIARRRRA